MEKKRIPEGLQTNRFEGNYREQPIGMRTDKGTVNVEK